MKRQNILYLFLVLVIVYASLVVALPVNPESIERYNLSATSTRLWILAVEVSIFIQFITTTSATINRLSLTPILLFIYLLGFFYAVGFTFVARGVAKLKHRRSVDWGIMKKKSLYSAANEIGSEFLGPANERFMRRQILTHLDIQPEDLQEEHLKELVEWVRITFAVLTDDKVQVNDFANKLLALSGENDTPYNHKTRTTNGHPFSQ